MSRPSPMTRAIAVLASLALVVLLAAACKGGGGGAPQPTATPAAGETPADGDAAADGDVSELARLAAEAEGITARVTYNYRTEVDGQVSEGTWTITQRPPDLRFETGDAIIIQAGGMVYICSANSCLLGTEEQAVGQTGLLDPFFDVASDIGSNPGDVGLVDQSQREIAGVDATCYAVESAVLGLADAEICFSAEGILLLLRTDAAGSSLSLEATAVSMDVTDADFEPPYPVTELPGD